MKWRALSALLLLPISIFSQTTDPTQKVAPPPDKQSTQTAEPKPYEDLPSLLAPLRARALGPTNMGGRIMDISVYEKEPRIMYVGTASGGLWKTENGGITFNVVFDKETSVSIGAVALSQSDPNLVWVGTGESGSRNSTSWGDGVYKTTDGGKTWTNMGLRDTKQISRIVIDPKNSNVVYVAAQGHLWGPNQERGVYKTEDGGKTWKRSLYINDRTAIAELVMDPSNPRMMIAAAWERERKAYTFSSGGPGSGLYKTTDAGRTWRKIQKGLPVDAQGKPEILGRIGLSAFLKDPRIWIATVEARGAGGVYRSTDRGESWTKINSLNPRPFYFSQPRQDPRDVDRMYVSGVSLHMSEDQGKTFRAMQINIHADNHALWINPKDSNHFIVGNDGGVYQTRDRGKTFQHLNSLPIGQFYTVAFDNRRPYYVYGGLQDNGSWGGPTQTSRGGVGFYDWFNVGGGDGFHVQVDPSDWTTVYSESQGGAVTRINQRTGETKFIRPRPPQDERYRFSWSSPIYISPHNPRTVYFAGNKLFKSVNRGDDWKVVSPDLTMNDPTKQKPGGGVSPEDTGAERFNTIVTIAESPRKQGVLWVGTDDGRLQLSQNDGQTWTDVAPNIPGLPRGTWCSRVIASKYVEGRAYAAFDGHRSDDYKPYLYVTEDFGKTWTKLSGGLSDNQSAYVVREGEQNPDLLFLGTEMGLYVSLDRGQSWSKFTANGFPTVRVDDLLINSREQELVVGTHGRSIWILPIAALEQLTAENRKKDVFLCKPPDALLLGRITGPSWDGDQVFFSPNSQPNAYIGYFLKTDNKADVKIVISDVIGTPVVELKGPGKAGLNVVSWTPRTRGRRSLSGDYRVTLTVGGKDYITALRIEDLAGGTVSGGTTGEQDEERDGDGQ